ncbi:DUF2975 domain-containing protein [Parerythrobacter aurantius]|uniref:DUF2975 domain-containing protein n=1 Tax=Parerythrobacter aurantius TaxID=3127706 RepID=UPI0032546356
MKDRPNDLILLAGRILTVFLQAVMIFGGIVLVGVLGAIVLYRDSFLAEYVADSGNAAATFPVAALLGVFAIGLVIVAALFVFFGNLRKIITTVGEGDPFQPANADRLGQMGWLMLGVQLLFIPATAFGKKLAEIADEAKEASMMVDSSLDVTGILLVVILFILARVFRHGAAMRDDLEGTV